MEIVGANLIDVLDIDQCLIDFCKCLARNSDELKPSILTNKKQFLMFCLDNAREFVLQSK